MQNLESYSQQTKCPKCRCEHLISEYVLAYDVIKRQCTNCGYTFFQVPLDTAEKFSKEVSKEVSKEPS